MSMKAITQAPSSNTSNSLSNGWSRTEDASVITKKVRVNRGVKERNAKRAWRW